MSSRRTIGYAAGTAGAVLLLALVFAVGLTRTTDRLAADAAPTTAAPSTTPSTTAPTAPPPSPPPTTAVPEPFPEFVDVPDLVAFVEQQRGLTFREAVPVALVDDETFQQRARAKLSPDLEELRYTLSILGVIGEDDDIEALFDQVVSAVAGYYDSASGELLVRGPELTTEARVTIVHELTHALDDQWFGLSRPELGDLEDESAFTFEALVEGSATVVEHTYVEQVVGGTTGGVGGSPVLALGLAPYDLGEAFVEALLAAGGWPRVDAAFGAVPATSKEIMEPSRYLEGFVPQPVEPPPGGGEIIDEGLFGQYRFSVMLGLVVGEDVGFDLSTAWAGDWSVTWIEDEDTACTRVDAATAAPGQAEQWFEILAAWAADLPDADVVVTDDGLVRVTTCGPLPTPPPGGTDAPT